MSFFFSSFTERNDNLHRFCVYHKLLVSSMLKGDSESMNVSYNCYIAGIEANLMVIKEERCTKNRCYLPETISPFTSSGVNLFLIHVLDISI